MHLPLLALLQTITVPNNGTLVFTPAPEIPDAKWQCASLPSAYSKDEIKSQCPGLMHDLNVCCALWNDCFENGNGEHCNNQYFGCIKIVVASASEGEFEKCEKLPAVIKNHFNYIAPRSKKFAVPPVRLAMIDASPVANVYRSCLKKKRTFSTCLDDYKRKKIVTGDSMDLLRIDAIISSFNLRVCMEMTVDEDDGEECNTSVKELLDYLDAYIKHTNPVIGMKTSSDWKCGSTRFDTYVSQVLTGTGCFWLKEALNTCCKYQQDCMELHNNKPMCDGQWESCKDATVDKGFNDTQASVDVCNPFVAWSENDLLLKQNQLTVTRNAVFKPYGPVNVIIGVLVLALFCGVLGCAVIAVFLRRKENYQYVTGEQNPAVEDEESLKPE